MKGSHSYGCPFCIPNSFEGSIELGMIQPPSGSSRGNALAFLNGCDEEIQHP